MKKKEELKHNEKELIEIYNKKCKITKYASYFVNFYNICFDEIEEDDGFLEEGEIKKEAVLSYSIEFYLNKFAEQLNNGHSIEWANIIARNNDFQEDAIKDAYFILRKIDIIKANNELLIYCKSIGQTNPVFTNYFIQNFDNL